MTLVVNVGTDYVVKHLPDLATDYIPQCQSCLEFLDWVGGEWQCGNGCPQLKMPVHLADTDIHETYLTGYPWS
jgi:hypothetical protein